MCTKGTFVLTVGDCLTLNGDLGVLSAGPRAVSQGYTNGERKAIKGKYHDGIKGGYEKTKLPFHSSPSIIYMVIRASSYTVDSSVSFTLPIFVTLSIYYQQHQLSGLVSQLMRLPALGFFADLRVLLKILVLLLFFFFPPP